MSATHTWACFLLCISVASQNKTPDVTVTCFVSKECLLPCSFQPGSRETIEWFRQDVMVYKFDGSSGKHVEHGQVAGRASISTHLVTRGDATLTLKRSSLKDRGTYRCHVNTSTGEHDAKVIMKVEAPIQGLFLELSRMSGYEEMKCMVRNVFPAPRVTWTTEPPTFEDLRPVTRMLSDKQGLYMADSRLRMLNGKPDLLYICKVTTSYGGPPWTASLREREIKGTQGKDLTIPCNAPTYLNNPNLHWNFSRGKDLIHILSYDSQLEDSSSSSRWINHVELDGFRVRFGDGSLRLMDPKHSEHTGRYTCVFAAPHNTHTERSDVMINDPAAEQSSAEARSYWWVAGLVIGVLAVVLVGLLAYLKLRGNTKKSRNDPEAVTELNVVKGTTADSNLNESSPMNVGDNNGESGVQT